MQPLYDVYERYYELDINYICNGEACEMSISVVMWDIFDNISDSNDMIHKQKRRINNNAELRNVARLILFFGEFF